METGSFGSCHLVVHNQNPQRTVKTRTVKNLYHSYLGGACLFTSVVVAKDAKNAERQSAAGMLFCPGNIS